MGEVSKHACYWSSMERESLGAPLERCCMRHKLPTAASGLPTLVFPSGALQVPVAGSGAGPEPLLQRWAWLELHQASRLHLLHALRLV